MTTMEVEVGVLKTQMTNLEDAVKEMGGDVKTILHRIDEFPVHFVTNNSFNEYKKEQEIKWATYNNRLTTRSWVQNTLTAIVTILFTGIAGGLGYWIFHK